MHLGAHISVISSFLCKNLELLRKRRRFEGEPETQALPRGWAKVMSTASVLGRGKNRPRYCRRDRDRTVGSCMKEG